MVNVVVNGIGTVGKRVAHAVKLQDDMKLFAISTTSPSYTLKTALEPEGPLYGTDLYCSVPERLKLMRDDGMFVNGTLEELLSKGKVDLVVDTTPAGIGIKNKPLYEKYKVKAIFQGGEGPEVAQLTFNSMVNYNEAFNKQFVRVPSCNTTSLIRTLSVLNKLAGIKEVVVTIIRRSSDPPDSEKTLMNTVEPHVHIPSHHGPDVKTVLPDLNIKTMAVKVPTTLAHVHVVHAKVKKNIKAEDLKAVFQNTPRVSLLKAADGYTSTAIVIERFRDLGRFRGDMPEVVIWDESVNVEGEDVYWMNMVHSESIIIPENIDAIRAMFGIEKDAWKSIEKTNKSLGIK